MVGVVVEKKILESNKINFKIISKPTAQVKTVEELFLEKFRAWSMFSL